MTETGFHKAVRNHTLKVRDLEKISRELGLPMTYWFEDDLEELTHEEQKTWNEFGRSHEKMLLIEQLQEIIKDKNTIIHQSKKIEDIEKELNKCLEEIKELRKRSA